MDRPPPTPKRWPGRPMYPRALEEIGAAEAYLDPELYDATYSRRRHDLAFYLPRMVAAGRALELGCGTGRITLPAARAGATVVGVDRAPAMVRALEARLEREAPPTRERVRVVQGDLRSVEVGERFPLVIAPFNTFLHLYTRACVEACLARVKASLEPGGLFLFDVSLPRPGDLRDRRARGRRVSLRGRPCAYSEEFAYEPLEQILYVTSVWTPMDGGPEVRRLLAHRQFFPAELEAPLSANGLELMEATEWGEPPGRDPDSLVLGCRLAPGR